MTPQELVDQAASSFVVLYHNDTSKLNLLLRQALGKYSDKAGVTVTASIPFTAPADSGASVVDFVPPTPFYYAPLPAYFKDIVIAKDAKGLWHEVTVGVNPADGTQSLILQLNENESVSPMSVEYFVELRDWSLTEDLPVGVASQILDYLIALIAIPNTDRERAVALQAGQQIEVPSRSELQQRVDQIELAWEENSAFIGSAVIW